MKPNAHVQQELTRLDNEWWIGMDEGYEANPNPLPTWFSKPYRDMTARERGYIFGRELKLSERTDE